MRHVLIVNPCSGRGAAKAVLSQIEAYFQQHQLDFEIHQTQYPMHAKELASQYRASDDVLVYSVGGDGTLWEVINGLQKGVPFAILPYGTGNDFFKMLQLDKKDLNVLLDQLVHGKNVNIDYGSVIEEGKDAIRFLNCFCFGLDAEVNAHMNNVGKKRTWIPKGLLYVTSALQKACSPQAISYTMERKEGIFHNKKLVSAIMNGRYYGGGFTPTPYAQIDDGRFDLCLIDPLPTYRIFPLLVKYSKGNHLSIDEVQYHHLQDCTIAFEKPTNCTLDGEMFVFEKVKVKMEHHGLCLRVPRER